MQRHRNQEILESLLSLKAFFENPRKKEAIVNGTEIALKELLGAQYFAFNTVNRCKWAVALLFIHIGIFSIYSNVTFFQR